MRGASRNFPFRRNTTVSPFLIPATDEPSRLPVGPLPEGVTAFGAVNSYPVWIRLMGTTEDGPLVSDGQGWLFPPGFFGIFSSQYPMFVSAVAVDRPGFPIYDASGALLYPNAHLEIFYGSGA